MIKLSHTQNHELVRAVEAVWSQIGHEIPEDTVSAYEVVETCLDADRLKTFGHDIAYQIQTHIVQAEGYSQLMKALVHAMPYSQYEAGGRQ